MKELPVFVHQPRTGGNSVEAAVFESEAIHHHRPTWKWKRELPDRWANAPFRFATVRNPYTWIESLYWTNERGIDADGLRMPLGFFLERNSIDGGMTFSQSSNIFGVDFWVKTEDLSSGVLGAEFEKRGFDAPDVGVENKGSEYIALYNRYDESSRRPFNQQERDLIWFRCRDDFERFGYLK